MPPNIATEIDDLHTLTTGELAERYEDLHGQPCRTRHRAYLIRKIAWRIQANAEGDLSDRARKRAVELADDAEVRVMAPKTQIYPPPPPADTCATPAPRVASAPNTHPCDPRLPIPGAAIVRQYKGKAEVRHFDLALLRRGKPDARSVKTLQHLARLVPVVHSWNPYLDEEIVRMMRVEWA